MRAKKYILFVSLLIACGQIKAQFYSLPNNHSFNLRTEKAIALHDTLVYPAMQPYIPFFNERYLNVADTQRVFRYISNDPAIDLIFKDHLIRVEPPDQSFTMTIDPILNLELGRDISDTSTGNLYTNTRGIIASGRIGEKFYFETMFAENQSVFPAYIAAYAGTTGIIPGQGRWKSFKKNGFDYAFASGIASIQVWRNINLQFGHGKQKVGHGYRSLLLSDNAFNYPFARITQQWFRGRLRYTNIYASLMELSPAAQIPTPFTERLFRKKSAAFQYLELQPFQALHIALFQGVITKGGDSRNVQHPDWQYFNPVIFSHWATYGLDDPSLNVLTGADILIRFTRRLGLYMQFMTDRINTGGLQAGLKYFDAFGLRNLTLRTEYNRTDNDSYHSSNSTSYTHYNQNLAFTPPNGNELLFMADYRKSRIFVSGRFHRQLKEANPEFRTDLVSLAAGYVINPSYNLNISLGYLGRQNFSYIGPHKVLTTNYLYLSLKTSIYNFYYDF